ncbi:MAG: hypothetical protein KBF99_09920 [Leptospiraceae bacterium]|nr:hypothetical protein [Leptospiraceae bacterium]MBK7056059.1 hypothetical protein [Leptospiraceae bacterium]MBK9498081.1 hypothetical protein [Leptospiraceae bacterium]MBL0265344.1 hypothetical protein [Leptospiraceae bacterium]MBP9163490.1 hypothetical protein [Leptospiraceae bacterium]
MIIIDKEKLSAMSMDEIYFVLEEEQFFIKSERLINDPEIQSLIGKLLCDYLLEINCLFINRQFEAPGSLSIISQLFIPSNNIISNLQKKIKNEFQILNSEVEDLICTTIIFKLLADDFYNKLLIRNRKKNLKM